MTSAALQGRVFLFFVGGVHILMHKKIPPLTYNSNSKDIMAEVKLENVSKVYEGNVTSVKNFNLTVNDKEFVVLVGPSGCGKSTTLRMIAGLEEISEGTIRIDGRIVNDTPPKDRDIAMVFQNYALYPHMTVYENLAFGLKLRKYSSHEIESRVHNAAQILGIEEYLHRKPKALSGGQRQRVALGRAIVRQPKVFLFDEPLSNLDANLRVHMRTEISRLHRRLQSTMIYVTHDQVEAMSMGDRIVVMKDGIIQQVDTPLNIYHHPANKFVAGFIGSPTMNFISGTIARNGRLTFQHEGTGFALPIPAERQAELQTYTRSHVVAGIRPEHIYAAQPPDVQKAVPFSATVEVVEPVGNEVFVYFSIGTDTHHVARLATDTPPEVGKPYTLFLDVSKVHFFDSDSGRAL